MLCLSIKRQQETALWNYQRCTDSRDCLRCRDSQPSVSIDLESYLDPGNAALRPIKPLKTQLTNLVIVRREEPLPMKHFDYNAVSAVRGCSVRFRFPAGNRAVPWYDLIYCSIGQLNAKCNRGNLEDAERFHVDWALKYFALNGSTMCNRFIWLDCREQGPSIEVLGDRLLDLRDVRGAAEQKHFRNLTLCLIHLFKDSI